MDGTSSRSRRLIFTFAKVVLLVATWRTGVIDARAHGEDQGEIAQKSYDFLKKYCHACHGVNEEVPRFRVLDRSTLIAPSKGKKLPYVDVEHAVEPERSLIWRKVVKDKSMPPSYVDPKENPFPSDEERKVIDAWVRAGAPFPSREARAFVSDEATLEAMRTHLRSVDGAEERKFQRYFVLTNLHNDRTIVEDQMRSHRAATSMLLNSLSWRREIRVPKAIDSTGVILQIDLRWFGWTPELWDQIAAAYPYGVSHGEDQRVRELEDELGTMTGTRLPFLRADWFVSTASQPPLYDRILELPGTLAELEKGRLSLDTKKNFTGDELARAGLVASGISLHNRMIDRHVSPYGAYWRSFDFNSSDFKGNIVRFPLGPKFEGNPYNAHAFEQVGGEVIFNLPNGLQGYMLVDAKDRRLDGPAPVTIVRDRNERAGSPQVVNGLSCMACHTQGIIEFRDVLRDHPAVFGKPREKLRRLFVDRGRMKELVDQDRKQFLDALDRACGSFLKIGEAKGKKIEEFAEPVSEVVLLYLKDLTMESAASDLGLDGPAALKAKIEGNDRLREIGLGPLLIDGGLKRQLWQRSPLSLFHQVGFEVGLSAVKTQSNQN